MYSEEVRLFLLIRGSRKDLSTSISLEENTEIASTLKLFHTNNSSKKTTTTLYNLAFLLQVGQNLFDLSLIRHALYLNVA